MQTQFPTLLEATNAAHLYRTSDTYYTVKSNIDGWRIELINNLTKRADFYNAARLLATMALNAKCKGLNIEVEETQTSIRIKYNFHALDKDVTFTADKLNLAGMARLTNIINIETEYRSIA